MSHYLRNPSSQGLKNSQSELFELASDPMSNSHLVGPTCRNEPIADIINRTDQAERLGRNDSFNYFYHVDFIKSFKMSRFLFD